MYCLVLFIVAVFATTYVSAQSNEVCPPLFLRYTTQHTYCKPKNPTCSILRSFVSQEDIEVILREHNNYRSKIASGKELKLPTAANMMQMVWDDELAAVAQKHASQCMFEHDCANCRRVQNFGVGQNLASEVMSYTPNIPDPNWQSAVKSWYDEITFFQKDAIDPFKAPPPEPTYGHFSQVVWAESWRVGCGYVLYQEGNMYKKLYTCNYGPAGNIVEKSMYKIGTPCSACPVNSCCGKTCGTMSSYQGLCKITDNRGPTYKPQGNYIFYCDFQNQADCKSYSTGQNNWLIYNTLSGNYLGIVLKGGQESSMVFANRIKEIPSSSFCFVISYRKGPNVAGQEEAHKATETFTIVDNNYEVKQDLPDFGGDFKQQFSEFKMALGWNMETEVKVTFSVPPGKPEQFLEIESLFAYEGSCNN